MKRIVSFLASAIVVFGALSSTSAADRLGIGAKVGTLGLGFDLAGRITPWLGLRATFNAGSLSKTYDDTGVPYDGDLTLGAYGALVDFYPMKGSFRLTAGYMMNRNEIDLLAGPLEEDTQIGDTVYTPEQIGTLTGKVEFDDSGPYFGIGLGNPAGQKSRFRFLLDVGVLMQGSPQASLSSTGVVVPSDIEKEIQEFEDDTADYDFWPVIALGVGIRL